MSEPWERLPDETDKAWAAFSRYLDAGPDRTLSNAEEPAKSPKSARKSPKKPPVKKTVSGSVKDWSKRFRWRERANAWDGKLFAKAAEVKLSEATRRAKEQEQRRKQVDDDDWVAGSALLIKGLEILDRPLDTKTMQGPGGQTVVVEATPPALYGVAVRMLNLSLQMRRTAVGLASRFSATGRLPDDAAARIGGAAVPPAEDKPTQPIDDEDMPPELAAEVRAVIANWARKQLESNQPG